MIIEIKNAFFGPDGRIFGLGVDNKIYVYEDSNWVPIVSGHSTK